MLPGHVLISFDCSQSKNPSCNQSSESCLRLVSRTRANRAARPRPEYGHERRAPGDDCTLLAFRMNNLGYKWERPNLRASDGTSCRAPRWALRGWTRAARSDAPNDT